MRVTLEERGDCLEGKAEEHTKAWLDLKEVIDSLDQRLSLRIDGLDRRLSRYLIWIIGIQVSVLLAIIGLLLKI